MNRPTTLGRVVRGALFGALAVASVAVAGSGCLDRPVAPATPLVSARVIEYAKQNKVNKIDLLFMIDNSSSMADKQTIMADAVPELVDRLIQPKCVDPITLRTVGTAVNGVCPVGELDFEPIKDIHIGIVTSSLGNHGAGGVCEDNIDISIGRSDPHNNDQGRLVSRGAGGTNVPTFANKGFLFYNPTVPGGLPNAVAVATPFTDMVRGVGQHGCGYEASLEAVYRFLVDPDPYSTIRINTDIGGFGTAQLNGTDTMLLQQRADFLRADSLVSIMIMTDENDCSVQDGGQGFYALLPPVLGTGRSVLKAGTSKCNENPNDKCCFNCGVQSPPAGCAPAQGDPQCDKGELLVSEDQPNLRCFDQKRRYGVDFLYPVQRYIDGFTKGQILNRKNELVNNPLFSDLTCKADNPNCGSIRDKSLVFVAGIVGVPWQNIAINPADLTAGYKTAKQIDDEGIWADILGDPNNASGPIMPRDLHMVESIKPRNTLPGPGSGPTADNKHGHEWEPSRDMAQPNADLQYACIFPLKDPKICTEAADCDCWGPNIADVQNPLCQNQSNTYTTTQLRAKAYPATRILQVLRGIDASQAIVASICAANVTDKTRDDYGYSPAIRALVGRLRNALRGRCLPRTLEVDVTESPAKGNVPCIVVEAFTGPCNCGAEPGREPADQSIITPAMREDGASCFCEIKQLRGDPQRQCKTNLNPPSMGNDPNWNGWCYVDPQIGPDGKFDQAQCPVVRSCPATEKRLIKFINTNSEPRPGATAYIMCQEKSFPTTGGQGAGMGEKCN